MASKQNIKTRNEALMYVYKLKSRVAKDNAIRWFIKHRGWFL